MFSKPIAIAASVASAQAALMAVTATAHDDGAALHFSDAMGCGFCLSLTTSKWIGEGASPAGKWANQSAAKTVSINAAVITGDICCGSAATAKETGGAATFCGGAFADATANTAITYAANDYFQASIAQCPHNLENCVAAAVDKAAATIAITDQRYIALDALGSYVTLSMKVVATASLGTAPSLKQRKGDVCTWVVTAKCDAPVITVPSTSGALGSTAEFEIQVTEWTEEFTPTTSDTKQGATWLPTGQSGASGNLVYPPLAKDLSGIITDLQGTATAPVATTPNNLMGEVGYTRPTTASELVYEMIPGNTLVDWITWLESVYSSYNTEKTAYDTEAALWKTYAEYKAPEPGLFGPTADPDAPKTMSTPRAPTQPVAVPDSIANLGGTTPTVEFNGKAGYGWPSAYKLTPVASKTVRPFGTLPGKGLFATTAVAVVAEDKGYSMRKTTNKDSTQTTGYKATCNKSYLMITGWLKVVPATALEIKL